MMIGRKHRPPEWTAVATVALQARDALRSGVIPAIDETLRGLPEGALKDQLEQARAVAAMVTDSLRAALKGRAA